MNMHVISAVARRDLRSWFGNPVGYIFIVVFVAASVLALMWSRGFFQNNLANLDTLNEWFPNIALGFVAAVTMGTWNSERANGTQELLFTLPAGDLNLLLGKYLAAAGVYTLSLAFMIALPIGLAMLGNPDWGQMFASFLGYWLFGLMTVAITMTGSMLVTNLAVAFVLGGLLGSAVIYSGWLMSVLTGSPSWEVAGPVGQFLEFGRGMVAPAGVLLFLGVAAAFLYLNLVLLGRRHWRHGELEGVHGTGRFVSLLVGAIALVVVLVRMLLPIDATVERIYSLGDESRKLLATLDSNRPVYVTAFVSAEVPEQLVAPKRNLLNLLDQFDAIGGAAFEKDIKIVEPFSPETEDAEKNYGIQPRAQQTDEGGELRTWTVYLGFVVQSGTEEVVVPFVDPGLPIEYELTRSIRTASNVGRKKIGVLKTDVELAGGMDFQTFKQKPRWQIVDELQLQYKIENVDATKDYPEGIDALVVPQPNTLGPAEMDRLKTWITAGNPTLLIEDPAPMEAWRTSIDDKKGGGGPQDMFGGGGGEPKGDLVGMLAGFGIAYQRGELVWDTSSTTVFGGRLPFLEIVFVGPEGMAKDSSITNGLQQLVWLWGGHVKAAAKDGFTFQPLVKMPDPSGNRGVQNGTIPKLQAFQFDAPWNPGGQPNPNVPHKPADDEFILAARVTGKPAEGQQKGVNLIYVADLDMMSNQMFALRRQSRDPNLRFDNVPFLLNCIDTLAGDESLVELRKRQPVLRKLTAVEASQHDFEKKWALERQRAEEESEKALKDAQDSLDAAVAKVKDNQDLDEMAKATQIAIAQENENNKFSLTKAQIERDKMRRIERAAHERENERRAIHNGFRFKMLLLAPIPPLLFGLLVFFRRRSRELSIVPQNRKVAGGVA
ncbi:MAG: Gldg family protein [Planctomycetes bacterium]|nr:Gldg family protein [Planctomycetota bacterium]